MKAILPITVCCLLFSLFASGQQAVKPIKVGEFEEPRRESRDADLHEKVINFLERLATEPATSRGAIVFTYRFKTVSECLGVSFEADKRVEDLTRRLIGLSRFGTEKIAFIEGQLSHMSHVEFWVVPQGAPLPTARYEDFLPPCACPPFSVYGIPRVPERTKSVRFAAWLGSVRSNSCAKYKWKVTGGRITSGQGTDQITVEVPDMLDGSVTAALEIEGTDPACNCVTSAWYTTKIGDGYIN